MNRYIKKAAAFSAAAIMAISAFAIPAAAEWHKTNSGKYYYTDSAGKKLTGLHKIGKNYYYFDKNGYRYTGWIKKGKSHYYFGCDGKRVTGWKTISGKKYYFLSNGKMATGKVTIGGKIYSFSSAGVWDGKEGKKPSGAQEIINSAKLRPDCFLADGKDEYGFNAEMFSLYWNSSFSEKDADKLIQKKLAEITKGKKTTYDKVKAVYDWIIKNTKYGYGGFGNYLSADSIINDKKGTCSDYSYLFMAMMRYMGLDAKMVSGQTHKADGGYTGHEWVEITINKTVYVFDPQVEDNIADRNGGKIQYQRFCKTYSEVKDKYKK